ncbi:MAG: phosphoglycerate mutase family protein [Actinobacteria bacterium]|nr:phosphoglycerate mutase family protein [Actinomycetota bacterium]
MPAEIYAVRHAETVLGERDIVNGDPSVENPLTERGRQQARDIGARLATVDLGICITTEFQRTHETADLILAGRDVPRLVIAALNDPRQGQFEGESFASYARWMDQSGIEDAIPGGGESQIDCVTRYAGGWRTVAEKADLPVLVVAHAFPISVALTIHDDEPPFLRRNYERDPAFAEVNVLDPERLKRSLDVLEWELRAYATR